MEKRSRRRTRDLVTQAASQGLSQNEIGCARISMMARSTNAPCKGRIQMRKTNPLHFFTFGLQRTAGPYSWVKTGKAPCEQMFSAAHPTTDIAKILRHVHLVPIGDIEWLTSRPSTMSAASHPSDTAPRSSALRSARNSVQCPSRMRGSLASEPDDCRGRNLLAIECNS